MESRRCALGDSRQEDIGVLWQRIWSTVLLEKIRDLVEVEGMVAFILEQAAGDAECPLPASELKNSGREATAVLLCHDDLPLALRLFAAVAIADAAGAVPATPP